MSFENILAKYPSQYNFFTSRVEYILYKIDIYVGNEISFYIFDGFLVRNHFQGAITCSLWGCWEDYEKGKWLYTKLSQIVK